MVNCKTCVHCTKASVYEWIDDIDNQYHRIWQYECNVGGWIDEKDATEGDCPAYIQVTND